MEYIVDFTELDAALLDKMSGCLIDSKPVPVNYFDPDVELTQRSEIERMAGENYFPQIVINRQSEIPDFTRWDEDDVRDNPVTTPDPVTGEPVPYTIDVRRPPEPWNVFYSIRLIAEYQQDLVAMKNFYRRRLPLRGTYLTIKGVKYDISHHSFNLLGGGYKEFGKMVNGKREFGEVYLIKVETSLDIHERETKEVAREILLRRNP